MWNILHIYVHIYIYTHIYICTMCVCIMYIFMYYVSIGGWVVCVCVRACRARARASNHACFCICGGFRFPHTRVYHQQTPTISIRVDRQMDGDKVYTVCEAFQFTHIFVMNEREF